MKLSRNKIRRLILEEILDSTQSEMRQFSESRSGKKVMQQGNKIRSAAGAIRDIADDQTGSMKEALHQIAEFDGKVGGSLAGLNELEEGDSVTSLLPTASELKRMGKAIERLERTK